MFNLLTAIESRTTTLTIDEVAELLRVSPETVRRMATKKQIPAFKIAGQWRFNPSSLGYWLRQRDPMAVKASKALAG